MINGKRVTSIIPARAGSKRIPGKNKLIFEYGFNKTIFFKVNDLTELDFVLLGEKKIKIKIKKNF